mmetsp:Transcript_47760/g.112337  ORF Transcript_47760/g.112337 Transcript_47760/m.112337 type:complete len:202 (+) Transcript_47760:208-813(+)
MECRAWAVRRQVCGCSRRRKSPRRAPNQPLPAARGTCSRTRGRLQRGRSLVCLGCSAHDRRNKGQAAGLGLCTRRINWDSHFVFLLEQEAVLDLSGGHAAAPGVGGGRGHRCLHLRRLLLWKESGQWISHVRLGVTVASDRLHACGVSAHCCGRQLLASRPTRSGSDQPQRDHALRRPRRTPGVRGSSWRKEHLAGATYGR